MIARLLEWLVPVRLGNLTAPADEHRWGFGMGCNYAGWFCQHCNLVVWGCADYADVFARHGGRLA